MDFVVVVFALLAILTPIFFTHAENLEVAPNRADKAGMARWLARENYMGALGTISKYYPGYPFSQITSYAEGADMDAPGVLYFYTSTMDTSMGDIAVNANVSFAVTAATLPGRCDPSSHTLDPESPPCPKATFVGSFVSVSDPKESQAAKAVLFERHPAMKTWPDSHDWGVWKINIEKIWLIDIYGGPSDVSVDAYFSHK
jgi:hypothetical protein